MTPERFADWLQGFAELNPSPPDATQWQIIKDHLALLFEKVTPARPSIELFPIDVKPVADDFVPSHGRERKVRRARCSHPELVRLC